MRRDSQLAQQNLQALAKEVEVLEESEHAQVQNNAGSQQAPLAPFSGCAPNKPSDGEIQQAGEEKQTAKAIVPPAIEDITSDDNHQIPEEQTALSDKIGPQEQCEEDQEIVGVE